MNKMKRVASFILLIAIVSFISACSSDSGTDNRFTHGDIYQVDYYGVHQVAKDNYAFGLRIMSFAKPVNEISTTNFSLTLPSGNNAELIHGFEPFPLDKRAVVLVELLFKTTEGINGSELVFSTDNRSWKFPVSDEYLLFDNHKSFPLSFKSTDQGVSKTSELPELPDAASKHFYDELAIFLLANEEDDLLSLISGISKQDNNHYSNEDENGLSIEFNFDAFGDFEGVMVVLKEPVNNTARIQFDRLMLASFYAASTDPNLVTNDIARLFESKGNVIKSDNGYRFIFNENEVAAVFGLLVD